MRKHSFHRKLSALVCAIATAIIGIDFSLAGKQANAGVADLTCTGLQTASYTPGLTNTPRQTHADIKGSGTCTSLLKEPAIISTTYELTFDGPNSCSANAAPAYQITYHFNNGTSSIVNFTGNKFVEEQGETILVSTGTVTSGKFLGDTAVLALADTNEALTACGTEQGVISISGDATLTFNSVP